jgi:hypothetical protein
MSTLQAVLLGVMLALTPSAVVFAAVLWRASLDDGRDYRDHE